MNFVYSRIFGLSKVAINQIEYGIQARCYSLPLGGIGKIKKLGKSKGPAIEKVVLPVETDVNRLLKYCCGTNLLKEGGEDIELKPDSEYPEWLWTLRTGPAPTLEELDPNTKAYWRKVRKQGIKRNNMLASLRRIR